MVVFSKKVLDITFVFQELFLSLHKMHAKVFPGVLSPAGTSVTVSHGCHGSDCHIHSKIQIFVQQKEKSMRDYSVFKHSVRTDQLETGGTNTFVVPVSGGGARVCGRKGDRGPHRASAAAADHPHPHG